MSAALRTDSPYPDRFQAMHDRLPGHHISWVRTLRASAIKRFADQGFPTTRDENWKYTNIGLIAKREFTLSKAGANGFKPELLSPWAIAGMPSYRMVFINGHFSKALSDLNELPDGVHLRSLAWMLEKDAALLKTVLPGLEIKDISSFTALNAAFMADGAIIDLDDNIVVDQPIHLLFVSTGQDGSSMMHVRNLIRARSGSKATIIEHFASMEGVANWSNAATVIDMHDGARLEHYRLQQESSRGFHTSSIHVQQAQNSRYASHAVSLGAALARTDINTELAGQGAACAFNGLYMVDGRQHVDHHTRIDHVSRNCQSEEFYKGVLDDKSRAVFNGKVVVHEGADQTDARQANRNLLLSKDAEVDTKPELEIYADDVKCSHGATVGQLEKQAEFYLRSRGISRAMARNMLTYAFADDVIRRMRLAPVRKRLEAVVLGRLPEESDVRGMT